MKLHPSTLFIAAGMAAMLLGFTVVGITHVNFDGIVLWFLGVVWITWGYFRQ